MATKKQDPVYLFIKDNWVLLLFVSIIGTIYFFRKEILITFKSFIDFIYISNLLNYIFYVSILFILFCLFRHYMKKKRIIWCRFMPHLSDDFKSDDIHFMMSQMNKIRLKRIERWLLGKDWKSFMVRTDIEGNIYYYFAFDKSLFIQMKSALKVAYLNSKLEKVEKDDLPFPYKDKRYVGGRMNSTRKSKKRMLSYKRFHNDYLPNIINLLPADAFLKIDFKQSLKKKALKKIKDSEGVIKETQTKERTGKQKEDLKNLQARMKGSEVGFKTLISMATKSENGVQSLKSVGEAISTSMEAGATLFYKKYKNGISKYPILRPTIEMRDAGLLFVTGSELSNVVHVPNYAEEKNELIEKLRKQTDMHDKTIDLLETGVFNNENGVKVGFVKLADGSERDIKVALDSLKDHAAITGKTGSGKSSFIVSILDGLLKEHFDEDKRHKASGLTFFDPGQDTVLTLYNRLLKYYNAGGEIDWNKVNYLSLKETDYPLAMNLLDKGIDQNGDTSLSSIAESVSDIIETAMPNEAPVAKRLLEKCIETLLADEEDHNILDVKLLVKNVNYRTQVIKRIEKDPSNYALIDYWETEAEENLKTSEIALMNRLEVFSKSTVLSRMFGQDHTEFNFRKILDDGHINLIDMTGLSNSEMRIISGYMSYRFYKASIGRRSDTRLHILGFDETKVLGHMPYLSKIVAETRKFNLASLVGAQMFGQLDTELKNSLKEVQDNFISCLQGGKEAKEVSEFISDESVQITPKDLTRLNSDKREGYIALKDKIPGESGSKRYTLKVQIDPPIKFGMNGLAVEYKSSEETEALNTCKLIANTRRKFKPGIKHKFEIDFETTKRMQPNKEWSHLGVLDIVKLNDDKKEALQQELDELEMIRKGEILEGQIPIFKRFEQAKEQEKSEITEVIKTDEEIEVAEDNAIEDTEQLPLELINSNLEVDQQVEHDRQQESNKVRKVKVNEQGLFNLSDFIDLDEQTVQAQEKSQELEEPLNESNEINEPEQDISDSINENESERSNDEVIENSTNKKSRRRKIKDIR
ncbi:helicase HerA domain-containing protein [Mammaliicoccus sciuri]|uniref:helicase HerA domain-containing protein n=1 Tax=Mammaliicoccus sciuri TaxID=1296 RepID=UPI0018DDDE37|nr:DUF87 domain-containing protein [Mammaliicoccus sciuri]QPW13409.1 DUF87 domain-containing protein [Mammaliicoccus sciuri]